MISPKLQHYRQLAESNEERIYAPKAAFSSRHQRFSHPEEDHRLPYKRDVDRILHSKAYARYTDKTQVVYLVENDHVTHRSLHVQFVSGFSRGIAEILRLNLDLVEAIALGHDVGHPPFGHEGETYLSELSCEYGNGHFAHPLQSCRLFTEIEPLNLGLAVYDGFLCHDGAMREPKIVPVFDKTWNGHFAEREKKRLEPHTSFSPMTLEGALVKLCDTMSYVGKDIEDAISLGILIRDEVPKTALGCTNREILSVLAQNIIEMSYDKEYIALSDELFAALKTLRSFNFKKIYTHPKLKVESKKIKRSYRFLFETLLQDAQKCGNESYLWQNFLHNKPEEYLQGASDVQRVIDFIAGMTDGFFVKTLKKLIIPLKIELT